jgi:hypothetical protein
MEKVKNISRYNSVLFRLAIFFTSLGFFILLITVVLVVSDSAYFKFGTRIDLENASKLGSFISGLVGAVWTLSGIFLIILTFNVQKEQFEKQQFENHFFEMLKMLNEIVKNTKGKTYFYYPDGKIEQNESNGIAFFNDAFVHFKSKLRYDAYKESNLDSTNIFEESEPFRYKKSFIIREYETFHVEFRTQISHYFRYIYNIFKYILEERLKYKDEKRYIDLIQAQISTNELGLIFYNALSQYGLNHENKLQFFEWLDNYSFLENIDVESLLAKENSRFYPKTKFKFLKTKIK